MDRPVSCSLWPGDFEDRRRAWRALLEGRLLRRQWIEAGCLLTLSAAPEVSATARRLARLEADCCPWMEVQVTDAEGVVTVRFGASARAGAEAIRELLQVG